MYDRRTLVYVRNVNRDDSSLGSNGDICMTETKINVVKQWAINAKSFSVVEVIEELQKENERLKKDCSMWESRAKGLMHKNEMVDVYSLQKENAELHAEIAELKEKHESNKRSVNLIVNRGVKIENENMELKAQIEKMKCCENCKHHSFWGDELKCNFFDYDEEMKCLDDKHGWEKAE